MAMDKWMAIATGGVVFAGLVLSGCFVKLPQTPEQLLPGVLPDGKVITDVTIDVPRQEDTSNTYPDWNWWVPDASSPPGIDAFVPPEIAEQDVQDAGGLVFEWVCMGDQPGEDGTYPEVPPEQFGGDVATHSFVKLNQVLGNMNLLTVYFVLCGTEETVYVPERAWAFEVDEPTQATFQARCDDSCYLFLTKSGCEYEHFDGCWVDNDGDVLVQENLMPGLYLVGLEFPGAATQPPDTIFHFDLHVALNRLSGAPGCATDSLTSVDQLIPGECPAGTPMAPGLASVEGELTWDDVDDFYLACGPSDVPADKIGGMPDDVHAFDAQFPGGQPRTLSVEVTFPDGSGSGGHLLAITGSPCGAAESVIDCTWGSGDSLVLSDITVFPGERLYAVVDGLGSEALDTVGPVPYVIDWHMDVDCP